LSFEQDRGQTTLTFDDVVQEPREVSRKSGESFKVNDEMELERDAMKNQLAQLGEHQPERRYHLYARLGHGFARGPSCWESSGGNEKSSGSPQAALCMRRALYPLDSIDRGDYSCERSTAWLKSCCHGHWNDGIAPLWRLS